MRVSAVVTRQAPPVYLNGAHITEQNDDLPEKAELVTSTLVTLRPRYSSIQPQLRLVAHFSALVTFLWYKVTVDAGVKVTVDAGDCQFSITTAKPY